MDELTRQALPPNDYLLLLGASICVFNANNAFVIENIVETSPETESWHELIDMKSGRLKKHIANTISKKTENSEIANLFNEVVNMRNRIIHSFQITAEDGRQMLATKEQNSGKQLLITGNYLRLFITKNERLCDLLHSYRGC